MARKLHRTASSILIFTLITCPQARGGDKIAPEKIAYTSPAGAIESLGAIGINGRRAQSGTKLWGGELLQAPAIENARVTLNEIGQLVLWGGSTVKLVSATSEDEKPSSTRTLFAIVMAGEMTVRLNDRASARICAGDTIFALSPGSSARVLVREGRGRLLSSKGAVKEIGDWRPFQIALEIIDPAVGRSADQGGPQTTPGEYKIEPYNFAFSLGGYADIEARSTRYLQFRVTDKDDKPAPDLLLLILLKGKDGSSNNNHALDAGSINYGAATMRVKTDQNGVATARFDASALIGAIVPLEATIVKNNQTLRMNIRIVKPKGFWTAHNAAPLAAIVAVATTVAVSALTSPADRRQRPQVALIDSVVIP